MTCLIANRLLSQPLSQGGYMRRVILLILLFIVVLIFAVFCGMNWSTKFQLNLGFGSKSFDIPVILWTLCAFGAGVVCTALAVLISVWKKRARTGIKTNDKDEKASVPPEPAAL
jgi:uncharacterized integral membrane protein